MLSSGREGQEWIELLHTQLVSDSRGSDVGKDTRYLVPCGENISFCVRSIVSKNFKEFPLLWSQRPKSLKVPQSPAYSLVHTYLFQPYYEPFFFWHQCSRHPEHASYTTLFFRSWLNDYFLRDLYSTSSPQYTLRLDLLTCFVLSNHLVFPIRAITTVHNYKFG